MADKIVEFERFCRDCIHYNEPETDEPCDECLGHPVNIDSHKPVNYFEKTKKKGNQNGQ